MNTSGFSAATILFVFIFLSRHLGDRCLLVMIYNISVGSGMAVEWHLINVMQHDVGGSYDIVHRWLYVTTISIFST